MYLYGHLKKNNIKFWNEDFKISSNLSSSNGFVFVVPEYGGMATPNAKIFLVFNNGRLFHKWFDSFN